VSVLAESAELRKNASILGATLITLNSPFYFAELAKMKNCIDGIKHTVRGMQRKREKRKLNIKKEKKEKEKKL
jgi:hypothetical protein